MCRELKPSAQSAPSTPREFLSPIKPTTYHPPTEPSAWNLLPQLDKEGVIDFLHSWNPWNSSVIGWDIKEMKFSLKKLWESAGALPHTLAFQERVYAVADANYVFWGILHGLAKRDGIRTDYSSLEGTTAPILAYRFALGGIVYAGTSTHWDAYETIEGKLAWAMFGYEVGNRSQRANGCEGFALESTANSVAWPYALSAGLRRDFLPLTRLGYPRRNKG